MILPHLLARQVHTHPATPDVLYITGWDDNKERQECTIVTLRMRDDKHTERLFAVAEIITSSISEGTPIVDWSYRLAFVRAYSELLDWTLQLDPLRITADEYALLAAEAEETP